MTWFYKIFSYGFQSAFHIRLISSSVLPLVSGTALFTKIKAAIDSSMKCRKKALLSELVVLLSPYAPHITEELSATLGHEAGTLAQATFPTWQQEYVTDDVFEYPIQITGKVRATISFPLGTVPADIEKKVLANETVQKWLDGKSPKKVIVVPKRIVNVVL